MVICLLHFLLYPFYLALDTLHFILTFAPITLSKTTEMTLQWQNILDTEDLYFSQIWQIYQEAFPVTEKRNLQQQKRILKNQNYNLSAIFSSGTIAGLIGWWDFPSLRFIEHIAIAQKFRGGGLGSQFLNEFIEQNNKPILLEVEKPEDEISVRRIEFYKRLGFHLNIVDYLQPPYQKEQEPLPLFVMTYPKASSQQQIDVFVENHHQEIYFD